MANRRKDSPAFRKPFTAGAAAAPLSGIGDPQELKQHGIKVRAAVLGVGKNLQDHISYLIRYTRRQKSPFQKHMRVDRLAYAVASAYFFGRGFACDVPIGVTAFLTAYSNNVCPDIQFLLLAAPFPTRPYLSPFVAPMPDGFGCRVVLLHPLSRGKVSLHSANPFDHPSIKQNFLAVERDRQTLRDSLPIARKIAAQPEMAAFIDREISPGPDIVKHDDVDAFIRSTGVTVHHPVGTCRMGAESDQNAVVDSSLQVKGVSHLRVADASVMPDLVGGNTNAAVIMIAEKAADMLRRAM
jgi:4-pyridoxate dehydrogenase